MRIPHEEKSFWLQNYGPYTPNPPLAGEIRADVAVIGAGFTGLSTAFHLRQDSPGLDVVVLEAEIVGFGASGRNGGFSMTLFGLEPTVTRALFGQERTVEAHRYMEQAVDHVRDLVRTHGLDSAYEHNGFLRVATTPGFVRRIQHDMEILTQMGITGIEWWEASRLREQVDSPLFLGAWWEPRCGLLDPAKHVRELKRLAAGSGAVIYESTPVLAIERGDAFTLSTPAGKVQAGQIVLATNAWSHLIPQLRRRQIPAFTHMVVTEPLTSSQLDRIGWKNRQGIEDARNLVHYFRLTADNRLAMGGSDVSIAVGGDMERDHNPRVFADLERDVVRIFPQLKGIRFESRWGGPVSVPVDMAPVIGFLGDRRAVFSLGCVGHGVSLAQLNGRTITDLLLEKDTPLTRVWFVGRRTIPWPPEPLRYVASQAIRGYLRAEDAWYERELKAPA
ncbi:MAG TPA: FAD-dependent oxidoreductase [Anaerolineales bacterium]|nr:FAD-dependent oxidoreductase [Anaerolineales bacterium]